MAELKWKKSKNPKPCWSGELRVDISRRRFFYENYYINTDELFKQIPKEEDHKKTTPTPSINLGWGTDAWRHKA